MAWLHGLVAKPCQWEELVGVVGEVSNDDHPQTLGVVLLEEGVLI